MCQPAGHLWTGEPFSRRLIARDPPDDDSTTMASRLPFKRLVAWIVCISALTLMTYLHTSHLQTSWRRLPVLSHEFFNYDLDSQEPADPKQTCQLPRLHPFDPSILAYLTDSKPIHCKARQPFLTFVDGQGYLRFNESAVQGSQFSCTYRELVRPPGDDNQVQYGPEKRLPRGGVQLDSDFVSVSCYTFSPFAPSYTNIHAQIKKRAVKGTSPPSVGKFSVLVLGIDSLSRLSFLRQLPKTYRYLTDTMGAFVFRGMTKVGDNTFPNLAAMLTGKSPFGELPPVKDSESYDVWPCIWKNFSSAGYATMFSEDRPDIALFNYLRTGFRNQPTTHYLRPFWLAVESSSLHRFSSHLCFGAVPKHVLQLNYTAEFVEKYHDSPFFGFSFLVELSHDYVSQVAVVDDDLVAWLRRLYTKGFLDNVVFAFISDHGHRFDAMRVTLLGRIEERMPFFALYVPPALREAQAHIVDALKTNVGRLTSPYDAYYTFLDVLQYSETRRPMGVLSVDRAMTLFGPISANRTCVMAGIPDHYCTCEEEQPLATDDPRVLKAAGELIATLNAAIEETLGNFSLCRRLDLKRVQHAELVMPSQKVVSNARVYFGRFVSDDSAQGMITKLRVVVEALPSNALFEATILHRPESESYTVLGDVSRINTYGSQSWCIGDAIMRKYCYCVQSRPLDT